MKFNGKMRVKSVILILMISLSLSCFLMIIPIAPKCESNCDIQSSQYSLNEIKILFYNEYANTSTGGEYENTRAAISTYYKGDYVEYSMSDYNLITSNLSNEYDVLIIPEQEFATKTQMETVGQAWKSKLTDYVNNGGVVICLDYTENAANTRYILDSAGLIDFIGTTNSTGGNTIEQHSFYDSDPLVWDVDSSWTAPQNTLSFTTTTTSYTSEIERRVIVDSSNSNPIVLHKLMRRGHIVYMGFDFSSIEENFGNILGRAVALSRNVLFDETNGWKYRYDDEFYWFVEDLVEEGFAVSPMWDLERNEVYLEASEALITTTDWNNYTDSEINIINNYVAEGRGVMICSDFDSGNTTDDLIEFFGFERNKTDLLRDSDNYTGQNAYPIFSDDNIKSHNITMGIDSIALFYTAVFIRIPPNAEVLISTDDDSTSTWFFTGMPARDLPVAVSFEPISGGRVVSISDTSFLTDDTYNDGEGTSHYNEFGSNEKFAVNVIKWLSEASYTSSIGDGATPTTTGIPGFALEFFFLTLITSFAAIIIFYQKRKA